MEGTMKLISWNVNGLRACIRKGFGDYITVQDADFFCLQETRMMQGDAQIPAEGYHAYLNAAEKKGYSGTAVLAKREPLDVSFHMGIDEHDHEGRLITLQYEGFFLVTIYTPNSQRDLARLPYRLRWEDDLRAYLCALDRQKPVIACGDLNVAHEEIDIKNPKTNVNNAGFTMQERAAMTRLIDAGFVDTFRFLHPDETGAYTWWSNRFNARQNNVGWRIDYFLVSRRIKDRVRAARIDAHVMGSDHCPIVLEIDAL